MDVSTTIIQILSTVAMVSCHGLVTGMDIHIH